MSTMIEYGEERRFDFARAGARRDCRPENPWLGRALLWTATALAHVRDRTARWQSERATARELGRLDDHMLRDIGLSRADLPRSASRGDLRGVAEILDLFRSSRPPPQR